MLYFFSFLLHFLLFLAVVLPPLAPHRSHPQFTDEADFYRTLAELTKDVEQLELALNDDPASLAHQQQVQLQQQQMQAEQDARPLAELFPLLGGIAASS